MEIETKPITLYRAGKPTEGVAFWTPSQAYAEKAHPGEVIHVAELKPAARIEAFAEGKPDRTLLEASDRWDVLIFPGNDGEHEYYVVNPAVLSILS